MIRSMPPQNSTNVRAITSLPQIQAGRSGLPFRFGTGGLLVLTLAAWGAFLGALAAGGVAERVGAGVTMAALVFVCAYAFAVGVLDPEVRRHLAGLPHAAITAFALGADGMLVIAWLGSEEGVRTAEWIVRFPQSWIAGTLAPLVAFAHAAVLRRPAPLSSARVKSPDGSPAAT